jgi:hypothetical protein
MESHTVVVPLTPKGKDAPSLSGKQLLTRFCRWAYVTTLRVFERDYLTLKSDVLALAWNCVHIDKEAGGPPARIPRNKARSKLGRPLPTRTKPYCRIDLIKYFYRLIILRTLFLEVKLLI